MSKIATVYIKQTLKLRDDIEGAFLKVAERLVKIHTEELWRGEYEGYEEFLTDMRISEPTANKMMQVWKVYVVEHKYPVAKLQRAGWSNLYTAIPLLKNHNVSDVVEKAMTLRRADIQSEVNEKEAGDHKHKWTEYKFRICEVCKVKEIIA